MSKKETEYFIIPHRRLRFSFNAWMNKEIDFFTGMTPNGRKVAI